MSLVALVCAASVPDPAQPVPLVLGILSGAPLFKYRSNLAAVVLGLIGISLGAWQVWRLRNEAHQ